MKKNLLSVAILCLVMLSLNAQPTWTAQNSNMSNTLYSIYFNDIHTGYAAGYGGKLLNTNNAGHTWALQTTGLSTDLFAVRSNDQGQVWACGSSGKIITSTNGGVDWLAQTSNTTQSLWGIDFANDTVGWIVGNSDMLLKTTNAGNTWVDQTCTAYPNVTALDVLDASNVWACGYTGSASGKILHTTDGGTTWTSTASSTGILYGIHFTSPTEGWIVGAGGVILHTADGGLNWNSQTSGTSQNLMSVYFVDSQNGWVGGANGTLLFTENGGQTWTTYSSGHSNTIRSIFFVNPYKAWYTGNAGTIRHLWKSEQICMVSFDTDTYKNLIVWERIPNQKTAYYTIYRFNTGNTYDSIGTVPYNQVSELVDFNSNPAAQSNRYKITATDSLGYESELSYYHETINMQASLGVPNTTVSLNWNFYIDESGDFVPNAYKIYRGLSETEMSLLIELSSANNSYNDLNVSEPYFYQIAVEHIDACTPSEINLNRASGGPYYQSTSNLEDEGIVNAMAKLFSSNELTFFPNPSSGTFNLPEAVQQISVYNATGQVVLTAQNTKLIDLSNQPKGIYTAKITQKNSSAMRKLILGD